MIPCASQSELEDLTLRLAAEPVEKESFWQSLYEEQAAKCLSPERRKLLARLRLITMPTPFNDGHNLFFLTGLFKSGTTWLGLMLADHPELFHHNPYEEIHAFSSQVTELYNGKPVSEYQSGPGSQWVKTIARLKKHALYGMLLDSCDKPWAKRFGGKGPVANVEQMIKEYPGVKIIIIARDGRDITVSAAFHYLRFNDKSAFADDELTQLNEAFVRQWARGYVGVYKRYAYLRQKFGDNISIHRYEDFLVNPYSELAEVLAFLQVSATREVVNQCVERNAFSSLSKGRKTGEEDKNSFFRKGVAGDWINYFTDDQNKIFRETAGETLDLFGYPAERPQPALCYAQ